MFDLLTPIAFIQQQSKVRYGSRARILFVAYALYPGGKITDEISIKYPVLTE